MSSKQQIERKDIRNTEYLTEVCALSGLSIDYALKYSSKEFLGNPILSTIADCMSDGSRQSLFNNGDGYCIVGHIKNNNSNYRYPEYIVFDTFRPDDDVFDRDPILIPFGEDGKPIGYVYRISHSANGYQWANKHILRTDAASISSLPEDAPAFKYQDVSVAVPGLSAEFTAPIATLEEQLDSVNAYWDSKSSL